MIRVFDDEEIVHVEGNVDPLRDIDIINEELRLKDIEYVERIHSDLEKKAVRSGDKLLKPEYDALTKVLHVLKEEKKWVRNIRLVAHTLFHNQKK
jgi:obg-like ATPase 1